MITDQDIAAPAGGWSGNTIIFLALGLSVASMWFLLLARSDDAASPGTGLSTRFDANGRDAFRWQTATQRSAADSAATFILVDSPEAEASHWRALLSETNSSVLAGVTVILVDSWQAERAIFEVAQDRIRDGWAVEVVDKRSKIAGQVAAVELR